MNRNKDKFVSGYWCVEYVDTTLEAWLDSLQAIAFKSLAKEIKLLQFCGNALRLPHSRSLGAGLFELRERRYGFRVYYTFLPDKKIVLLHAGDKSTQTQDIKRARSYLARLRDKLGKTS
ncbi:MAG: hypothetical protein DHS20C10_08910 [marine bacterium B5-7]|nr:MAG: hypothetical protein DHS20C10_08910 [marine bacterium B5-7]